MASSRKLQEGEGSSFRTNQAISVSDQSEPKRKRKYRRLLACVCIQARKKRLRQAQARGKHCKQLWQDLGMKNDEIQIWDERLKKSRKLERYKIQST